MKHLFVRFGKPYFSPDINSTFQNLYLYYLSQIKSQYSTKSDPFKNFSEKKSNFSRDYQSVPDYYRSRIEVLQAVIKVMNIKANLDTTELEAEHGKLCIDFGYIENGLGGLLEKKYYKEYVKLATFHRNYDSILSDSQLHEAYKDIKSYKELYSLLEYRIIIYRLRFFLTKKKVPKKIFENYSTSPPSIEIVRAFIVYLESNPKKSIINIAIKYTSTYFQGIPELSELM